MSHGFTKEPEADLNIGGGMTLVNVTGVSQAMESGNIYIANNAALVDMQLPAVASTSVGDRLGVMGAGAGGWEITQPALVKIIWDEGGVATVNETTEGVTGKLVSTDNRDSLELVCTFDDATNVEWTVTQPKGNIDLV